MIRVEQVVLRVVSQKPFFAYSPFFCSISTQSVEAAESGIGNRKKKNKQKRRRIDFSNTTKVTANSSMPKQNQEQEHASEYSLKTFPKRDRPANFIIELVPHSESTPPLRDLSPEALEDALKYIGCVKPSLSPRDCSIYLQYLGIDLEPSRIEEYASHWFTQSSSLHYGEDHMLHMDSRRFFLPSSIRTFLVSPPPIRGLVYPDASVGMGFALYSSHAF
ncbi:hypothetical protein WA538_004698 [Blastocystis sp. DL]